MSKSTPGATKTMYSTSPPPLQRDQANALRNGLIVLADGGGSQQFHALGCSAAEADIHGIPGRAQSWIRVADGVDQLAGRFVKIFADTPRRKPTDDRSVGDGIGVRAPGGVDRQRRIWIARHLPVCRKRDPERAVIVVLKVRRGQFLC